MAEPEQHRRHRHEEDSDVEATVEHDTVFIETSLDTRIVTVFPTSDSFTVSDAKRKIELEHYELYQDKGVIKILQLQVEHQGFFYCLSDSMHLASALTGSPKFLAVEASVVHGSRHDEINMSGGRNAAPCVNTTGVNETVNQSVANTSDPIVNALDPDVHTSDPDGSKKKKKKKRAKKEVASCFGEESKCMAVQPNDEATGGRKKKRKKVGDKKAKPVSEQPNPAADQHEQNGSSLMKKERKVRRKVEMNDDQKTIVGENYGQEMVAEENIDSDSTSAAF